MVCGEENNHCNDNILTDTSRLINRVMTAVCLNLSLSVTHSEGDVSHRSSL